MKYGIEVISAVIVEVLNVVRDVRDSLPKFGIEDLGRLWDAIKNGKGLMATDWKAVVAEARDLDPTETAQLGNLVGDQLRAQDINVENVDLLVADVLNVLDAILALVEHLPHKA